MSHLKQAEIRSLATENWRVIDEAPDYAVSDQGRVKRIKADRCGRGEGKLLLTPVGANGYLVCSLHVEGVQLHRRVHRLVCTTFHGPKPSPKHEVRHLDGDKLNPAAINLAWGTSAENKADSMRRLAHQHGEAHYAAKLTTAEVAAIRASTEHYRSIAATYGVSPHHIHRIRREEQRRIA